MNDQQRANLDSARRLAASRIGWTGPTQSIPYEKREAYATALANIILSYPDRFDAQTVATARRELTDATLPPLSTDSAGDRAGVFFGELGNQALEVGGAVAGIGEGVKTTLRAAAWAIPAAALILGAIYLYRAYERSR